MGQIWVWSSFAERVSAEDPYFDSFWTKPGFVGHDLPELLAGDLIDTTATITRVLTAQDVLDDPTFDQADFQVLAKPRHDAVLVTEQEGAAQEVTGGSG